MTDKSQTRPSRRSRRLSGWDYAQPSAYFVTVCTHGRQHLFGSVTDDEMALSDFGLIAQEEWLASERIRREVELDVFIIMPNHMHAVVWILPPAGDPYGLAPTSPKADKAADGPAAKSLGALMAGYKSAVTRRINQLRDIPNGAVWQRNYYDHVVRSERALEAIREYIAANPVRWELDRYNGCAIGPDLKAREIWQMLRSEPLR